MLKPDDGTPKTCWLRSALRKFELSTEACPSDKDSGKGVCYDKCPPGKGAGDGPVCWGKCPPKTTSCGPLCRHSKDVENITCSSGLLSATTAALSTGVSAASGDFLGAVMGSLAIVSNIANPICASFNT